jgi:hypothetical protein
MVVSSTDSTHTLVFLIVYILPLSMDSRRTWDEYFNTILFALLVNGLSRRDMSE